MFRTPPTSDLSSFSSTENNDARFWAHGFFYRVRQSALHFGHDRREPKKWRPGLSLRLHEPAITVLPCTRRNRRGNRNFFEIPPDEMILEKPETRTTFIYYRYETVARSELGRKIGFVSHPLRLKIMNWIVERYLRA